MRERETLCVCACARERERVSGEGGGGVSNPLAITTSFSSTTFLIDRGTIGSYSDLKGHPAVAKEK